MPRAIRLITAAFFAACLVWPGTAGAQSTERQDRLTAIHLSDQLPSAPDGWAVVRSTREWERGGATARRVFRGPGQRTISVVLEARTLGIMHRHEFLDDPDRARRYGYEVGTLPGVSAGSGTGQGQDSQESAGDQTDGQTNGQSSAQTGGEEQQGADAGGPQQILIKTQGERKEIRFWLDDRILVLVIGEAEITELRRFVRRLDLEAIRQIR